MNLELIVRLQEEAVAQKALGRRGLASLIQEAVDALLEGSKGMMTLNHFWIVVELWGLVVFAAAAVTVTALHNSRNKP